MTDINELPVIGEIDTGNGDELYLVDISDYEPESDFFDYDLVTQNAFGGDVAFATDASRTAKFVYVLSPEGEGSFYAYAQGNLYPVSNIYAGGKYYYVISPNACENVPRSFSTEELDNGTIFYAIDEAGTGGFYSYTEEGSLILRSASEGRQKVNNGLNPVPLIAAVFTAMVAGGAGFVLIRKKITTIGAGKGSKTEIRRRPPKEKGGAGESIVQKLRERRKKRILGRKDSIKSRPTDYFETKKQYLFVIRELTSREVRRKYVGSRLGILWSMLNPLLMMITMTLIFSYMFKRSIDNFPLYYLSGSLIWGLFSGITNHSMSALIDNKGLLLRSKIPMQVFILSRAYTALTNFGYTLIPFLLMLVVFRIRPSLTMLLLPADVLLMTIMSLGISYILATLYVFFEDIKYLYSVFLRIFMYLTAIFYPVTSLPSVLQRIINYNPVYMGVYIAREAMVYGRFPHYTSWMKLGLAAVAVFSVGIIVFRKSYNRIMQRI